MTTLALSCLAINISLRYCQKKKSPLYFINPNSNPKLNAEKTVYEEELPNRLKERTYSEDSLYYEPVICSNPIKNNPVQNHSLPISSSENLGPESHKIDSVSCRDLKGAISGHEIPDIECGQIPIGVYQTKT